MNKLVAVYEARIAAERFIQRAREVEAEIEASPLKEGKFGQYRQWYGGAKHAAMKRAALDLAKSLPPLPHESRRAHGGVH